MMLLLHLLLNVTLAQANPNSCSQHNPMSPDVPACPNSGSKLLSENYPIMAATVSDDAGGSRYVKEYVTKVLKAQPSKAPQFFLHVTDETWSDVVREIKKQAPDEATAQRWIAGLSRVQTRHRWNWQQDYFESFFDSKTGKPVLREVQGYGRHGNAFNDLVKKSSADCSISAGKQLTNDQYKSGHSGGNIEAVNGLCLVGSDHFEGNEWDKYAKVTCENPAAAVKTPSDFLNVGHTDEFFKTLKDPSQQAPCDFSLAFASPKKGLELLKKNPQGRAFDFSHLSPDEIMIRLRQAPYNRVCSEFAYTKALEKRGTKPGNSKEKRMRGVSKFLFDIILPPVSAGSFIASQKDAESLRMERYLEDLNNEGISDPPMDRGDDSRRQARIDRLNRQRALLRQAGILKSESDTSVLKDCYNMTNKDLAKMFEDDFEMKEFNESVEKATQQFKQDLLAKLKKSYPQCNPKTVDLPDLFLGDMDYDTNPPTYAMGTADSVFPNPTNGEIVENTFILPEPVNPAFKADIDKSIKDLGLKTDYIDTHFAHTLNGNLHCSSHAMRYCRPQGDQK
ncbi:protein-arginine deiminase family protein [Bdellovibrio sp.]|uniref:protein-arginine deiminase family protein n=1 Tax=Bdellovibrio TaxID=958 RepID=UPI003221D6B0